MNKEINLKGYNERVKYCNCCGEVDNARHISFPNKITNQSITIALCDNCIKKLKGVLDNE